MELAEDELVRQLKEPGLRPAIFSKIVRLYQEPLYWHIRKMVLVHEDANDLLQNTFLKAWNNVNNFRGESKLGTWLFRIATNETLTFLAQQRQRNMLPLGDFEEMLFQRMEADPYFDGDETEKKLQQAILSLPEKQRLVFNMKYFDNLKYEDMAAVLGTSVGALKASYHHAVKKITDFMKNH